MTILATDQSNVMEYFDEVRLSANRKLKSYSGEFEAMSDNDLAYSNVCIYLKEGGCIVVYVNDDNALMLEVGSLKTQGYVLTLSRYASIEELSNILIAAVFGAIAT